VRMPKNKMTIFKYFIVASILFLIKIEGF
jgi:hypothetical protein